MAGRTPRQCFADAAGAEHVFDHLPEILVGNDKRIVRRAWMNEAVADLKIRALGYDPVWVYGMVSLSLSYQFFVHTDPDDRQIEQNHAGQDRRPGEAKRGRRLHLVATVMDAVRGPEKADAVRAAMLDMEAEIDEQEQNDQADPIVE
jgi:hypothetical protein